MVGGANIQPKDMLYGEPRLWPPPAPLAPGPAPPAAMAGSDREIFYCPGRALPFQAVAMAEGAGSGPPDPVV